MNVEILLAADVGATNTRLRVSSFLPKSGAETLAEATVRTAGAAEIKEVISRFARQHAAASPIRASVLGLPGKISGDGQSCALSFLDPNHYVSFGDLFQNLNIQEGVLVNDLQCGILGLPDRADSRLRVLCGKPAPIEEPVEGRERRVVLVMPGTGLGVGLGTSRHLHSVASIPSEGGHFLAAIDPQDEIEPLIGTAILAERGEGLNASIPTYEDLLCGGAIPTTFRTIVEKCRNTSTARAALEALEELPPEEQPKTIESWALTRQSPFHRDAQETFAIYGRFLGRFLQSLTLTFLPNEVYLGGNVLLATHALLEESSTATFHHHPTHSGFLKTVPVYLALIPTLNLDGATRAAADMALGKGSHLLATY